MSQIVTRFFFPLLQRISPKLFPISGLEKQENGVWRSTDNDPQFSVRSHLFKALSGWVSIRVKIESEGMIAPKLYFDFGEGYSESRIATLYQIDENTYQSDVMLPSSPKNVRFDPAEEQCTFTVSLFNLRAHSEIFHISHQFLSIMKHDHYNGIDTLRVIKKSYARYKKYSLNGMLERLDKEYTRMHPFRKQKATSKHITYLNWIKVNEKNKHEVFDKALYVNTPLISVVMTVYNTPIEFLKKAIDSVIDQSYSNWELCIADDASNHQDTIHVLEEYMKENEKIHVYFREENGNISKATNSALTLAKGEYVAFLDHDDMLAPNALFEMVKVINTKPAVKFIYSDEDKIDEKGRRFEPHFKSDWNPDMFLSQNYISHLSLVKKSTLDKVENFRVGYEGAQDYDLFLRITRGLMSDEIIHIDKILYHWRAFEGSTAFDPEVKPYTSDAGLRALNDYFSNSQEEVKVESGMLPNTYKVSYPLKNEPLVTLIIPTRDGYDILSQCMQSILEKTVYKNYEIIIIDNQTTCSKTLAYLNDLAKTYQHISILKYDKVFNYSSINNFAVTHADGELIGLINNDVEVISAHWLTEMVEHALRPDIAAVGAKLYYENDTIQHAGVVLGIGGVAGHSHKCMKRDDHGYFSRLKIIQNYSAVTAACLVIRKALYLKVGGLEEKHLSIAFNDVDFCMKLQEQGFRNLWTPYVELYHYESVSRGAEDNEQKIARFGREIKYMQNTWGKKLQNDPFYNSNLTRNHENFAIKKSIPHDSK